MERTALTSNETVRAMQEKYGRPGISGRKRKSMEMDDVPSANVKIMRVKVRV